DLPESRVTTILGKILSMTVSNLGTSYTGPLTQLSYLRDYGIAPSTKYTVIVFFEGNDLDDLHEEYDALLRWKESDHRNYRGFKRQPSLLRALKDTLRTHLAKRNDIAKRNAYVTAYFKSPDGDIPVTLNNPPPGRDQLSEETMHRLNYFFSKYADFGRQRQITTYLAYMPCKSRVLHGQIEFTKEVSKQLSDWQPTDLPQVISELCDQYGIRFIDLTSALRKENKTHLVYNSIYDTHLNSLGSLVVAQEMAHHFAK